MSSWPRCGGSLGRGHGPLPSRAPAFRVPRSSARTLRPEMLRGWTSTGANGRRVSASALDHSVAPQPPRCCCCSRHCRRGHRFCPDALSPSQRHSLWFESKARIAERYTGISSGSRRGTGVESSAQTAPRWKRPWKSVSHQRRSESVDSEVRDTCLRKTTRSADGGASLFLTCQMHALRRVPLSVATRLRQPRCLRGLGRATHGRNGRRSLRQNGARSGHLGLTAGCTVSYSHTVSILL